MNCCRGCGHVYNAAFHPEETEYCSDYENSLFFSGKYAAYASSLAEGLVERFGLHGKRIVEIGCGSGDFLKLLCEKGGNEGIGFDPSAAAGGAIAGHPRITLIRDYYSSKHAHVDTDLVCCRHVLEHVESPLSFLNEIIRALPAGKKTALFFEVPEVMFILKDHSSWDLIYEHPSYFSTSSLHRLLSMAGCRVQAIWKSFHEQFLCVCAEPGSGDQRSKETAPDLDKAEVVHHAQVFYQVFRTQVATWEKRLNVMGQSKERVVLWGAGSKGVTFLNVLQGNSSVKYVVDINDRKHGKFIPGTGQAIVSPGSLKEYRPDTVILMNPAYEAEVLKELDRLNLNARVLPVKS
jgi:SAM-dependent methyltransferase